MSNQLTPVEYIDLERLEKVILEGKKIFVSVGLALTEIRERKLYRRDYGTFEAYCQSKWGWNSQRARQMISAASVVQQMAGKIGALVPTERAARELGKIAPEDREELVVDLKASKKPITAKSIKAAANPRVVKKQLDKTGCEIPKELVELWERGSEVKDVLFRISFIKCRLNEADKSDDPLWRECFLNKAISELESVYANLSTAQPFAVCSICQGHPELQPKGECRGCKGRGIMSKFRFDRVPDTIKKLRGLKNEAAA